MRGSNVIVRAPLILVVLAAGTVAGCAASIERINGFVPRLSETTAVLHGHAMTVRLSATGDRRGPLLVYATGDGGWFGKDKEIFNKLVPWGHPVAGFSAREYVHHLGPQARAVTAAQLAEDVGAVVDAAIPALDLPASTRVVLIGKSRGAGLDVAAALSPALQARLAGLLAIGLTREEEYVQASASASPVAATALQLYDVLRGLPVPIVVIQSTRDQYVPAAQAREWFGPDAPARTLIAIEARDHDFGGARPAMYEQMRRSLEVLCRAPGGEVSVLSPSAPTPAPRGTRASARPGDR